MLGRKVIRTKNLEDIELIKRKRKIEAYSFLKIERLVRQAEFKIKKKTLTVRRKDKNKNTSARDEAVKGRIKKTRA